MKAISMKPAGTAINFRISEVFSTFFIKFGVAIAAIGAAVSFAGAFAAMAAIYPTTNTKKGGER